MNTFYRKANMVLLAMLGIASAGLLVSQQRVVWAGTADCPNEIGPSLGTSPVYTATSWEHCQNATSNTPLWCCKYEWGEFRLVSNDAFVANKGFWRSESSNSMCSLPGAAINGHDQMFCAPAPTPLG